MQGLALWCFAYPASRAEATRAVKARDTAADQADMERTLSRPKILDGRHGHLQSWPLASAETRASAQSLCFQRPRRWHSIVPCIHTWSPVWSWSCSHHSASCTASDHVPAPPHAAPTGPYVVIHVVCGLACYEEKRSFCVSAVPPPALRWHASRSLLSQRRGSQRSIFDGVGGWVHGIKIRSS